mmetsp:Transcript_48597/g.96944  ORF Transcript_48597/g.96944 Transcript_48597/m.96944 type:complete len:87 (+) Transcript_48597:3-263(+)
MARELLPAKLQATSVDDASWMVAFRTAFLLSLLQSFLLVDTVKIACLSLTGGPLLASLLHGRGRCVGKWVFLKPIRRLHKILDFSL